MRRFLFIIRQYPVFRLDKKRFGLPWCIHIDTFRFDTPCRVGFGWNILLGIGTRIENFDDNIDRMIWEIRKNDNETIWTVWSVWMYQRKNRKTCRWWDINYLSTYNVFTYLLPKISRTFSVIVLSKIFYPLATLTSSIFLNNEKLQPGCPSLHILDVLNSLI